MNDKDRGKLRRIINIYLEDSEEANDFSEEFNAGYNMAIKEITDALKSSLLNK